MWAKAARGDESSAEQPRKAEADLLQHLQRFGDGLANIITWLIRCKVTPEMARKSISLVSDPATKENPRVQVMLEGKTKPMCVVPYEVQHYVRLGTARLVRKMQTKPQPGSGTGTENEEWWIEAEPVPGLVWPDGSVAI